MATNNASASSAVLALLVALLLAGRAATATNDTQRFRPGDELRRYRRVQALLRRLNKPALRTIQARACVTPILLCSPSVCRLVSFFIGC